MFFCSKFKFLAEKFLSQYFTIGACQINDSYRSLPFISPHLIFGQVANHQSVSLQYPIYGDRGKIPMGNILSKVVCSESYKDGLFENVLNNCCYERKKSLDSYKLQIKKRLKKKTKKRE